MATTLSPLRICLLARIVQVASLRQEIQTFLCELIRVRGYLPRVAFYTRAMAVVINTMEQLVLRCLPPHRHSKACSFCTQHNTHKPSRFPTYTCNQQPLLHSVHHYFRTYFNHSHRITIFIRVSIPINSVTLILLPIPSLSVLELLN